MNPHQTLCNTLNPNITASTYLLRNSAKFQSLVGPTQDKIRVLIFRGIRQKLKLSYYENNQLLNENFICLAKVIDTNLITNYQDSTIYPLLDYHDFRLSDYAEIMPHI